MVETELGYVDRIEQTSAGLRVVDYKTSASAMGKPEAARSIQLAFYSAAVERDGGDVVHAQMWYPRVRTKSVTVRELDLGDLGDLEEEMVEITDSIRSEEWAPKVNERCDRCAFRLSCPAWPEGRGAYLP